MSSKCRKAAGLPKLSDFQDSAILLRQAFKILVCLISCWWPKGFCCVFCFVGDRSDGHWSLVHVVREWMVGKSVKVWIELDFIWCESRQRCGEDCLGKFFDSLVFSVYYQITGKIICKWRLTNFKNIDR